MTEKSKQTYCTVYFDNFFSSPILVDKLFDESAFVVGLGQ